MLIQLARKYCRQSNSSEVCLCFVSASFFFIKKITSFDRFYNNDNIDIMYYNDNDTMYNNIYFN